MFRFVNNLRIGACAYKRTKQGPDGLVIGRGYRWHRVVEQALHIGLSWSRDTRHCALSTYYQTLHLAIFVQNAIRVRWSTLFRRRIKVLTTRIILKVKIKIIY